MKDGIITRADLEEARMEATEVARLHSPDLSKMVSVNIDSSTTIYVEQGKDPEEAKRKFIARREDTRNRLIREVRSQFHDPEEYKKKKAAKAAKDNEDVK